MINIPSFLFYFLTFFAFTSILSPLEAQINFTANSEFSYLKGSEAASLSNTWVSTNFDASSWPQGNAPFRYGDGEGGTLLPDMRGNYSTLYLRSSFNASNIEILSDLTFYIDYDDGFVLWINGKEVLKKNAPASMAYNALATADHESGTTEVFRLSAQEIPLQEGINYIAVQCFNVNLQSSDLFFDMAIKADVDVALPQLPDTVSLAFSHPAGFYDSPFDLTVSSPDPETTILYTLDGSNPQTSNSAFTAGTSATIRIDPARTEGRASTPAFLLRASVKKEGYKPFIPETRTFVFIEQVKTQAHPGGQWPNGNIKNQLIDLGVDQRISLGPVYGNQINNALLAIPSISVVTDMQNLFDPMTGIYVNAFGKGKEWEKASSIELLNPDGTEGFQVNAGLRIRGGYSRRPEVAKHSFRLLFRKEYGDGKLDFPLFGEEGVGKYDRLDLRTAQNASWHEGNKDYTFMRDVFVRDTQRDMGQPYTRSRYYHLYLNGMYWGVYQTQERAEAYFAESYLGGQEEDYDIIKVTSDQGFYYVEATDGNMDSWEHLYELTKKGFADNTAYYKLEGKDAAGNPIKGAEVLVDIDNLIGYMLVVFYSGNLDGPSGHFMKNKRANNFYAIFNRADLSRGFQFFTHDSEISMGDVNENRVNIGRRTDDYKMEVADVSVFHPQWLHFKLSDNPDYRQRFADRAYRHLNKNGTLTPEKALERLNSRVQELETAVIGESARWGDTKTSYSLNKSDHWIPAINYLRNHFIPQRTNILVNQLQQEKLYSPLNPPIVKAGREEIVENVYHLKSEIQIRIEKPTASGDLYYTVNDEDPRLAGGKISDKAVKSGTVNLTIPSSTSIKTRLYSNGEWSPLKQVDFLAAEEDFSHLKVTELHYHPLDIIREKDTLFGKDYEFIEFKNTGEHSINLTGLEMSEAVSFKFPEKTLLGPGQFFVVTSKPSKFYEAYGMAASGNFQGNLSNSGETIVLKDGGGNIIMNFTYDDKHPWPEEADGKGYSLVSKAHNPETQPNELSYWTRSQIKGGSPFSDDKVVLTIQNPNKAEELWKVYPNPSTGELYLSIDPEQERRGSEYTVRMYNTDGKMVFQDTIRDERKIDLKSLPISGGLYILKISRGNSLQILKIVYLP